VRRFYHEQEQAQALSHASRGDTHASRARTPSSATSRLQGSSEGPAKRPAKRMRAEGGAFQTTQAIDVEAGLAAQLDAGLAAHVTVQVHEPFLQFFEAYGPPPPPPPPANLHSENGRGTGTASTSAGRSPWACSGENAPGLPQDCKEKAPGLPPDCEPVQSCHLDCEKSFSE